MARFIVVQRLPAVATQDELIGAGRAMADGQRRDAKWLRSWVVPQQDQLVSEWEALDEAAVRSTIARAGVFAIEAVHMASVIEPGWFRA